MRTRITSAGERAAETPEPWTRGWRRFLLAAGMLVYPGITAGGVAQYSSGAAAVAGYVLVVVFCCAYILAIISASTSRVLPFWALLGVMAVLSVVMLPIARAQALFLTAVVVALATAWSRRYAAPIVITGGLVALIVPWTVPSWHNGPGWIQAVMVVFTALPAFAYSEITQTNRALLEARAEIAVLASEAERSRIARDLHDLLGHSLTAITVKAALARRLADHDRERSLHEIGEVEDLSRQALADVRATVANYRDVTLAGELARGRELLRASGISADFPTAIDVVDRAHQELLAWAVREGLTNVVRHARATTCTVELSADEVRICDDGAGAAAAWGNGLAGLRERVAASGGVVEAGPMTPRGWRLRVALGPTPVSVP
jgi:two-component system sensor histidine kinase DesK